MGKTKKNAATNNTATAAGKNNGNVTAPIFIIPAVEGDIRRKRMSTEEICRKYQKTEEELHALIRKAYHSSEPKVKELLGHLKKNDEQYNLRKASQARKANAQPVQANITAKVKSALEIQQDAVDMAQEDLASKTEAWNTAKVAHTKAKEDKVKAQENLALAKKALRDAEDREMMAASKEHTAEEELRASRAHYDQQVAVLNEMSTKKLIHISAIKGGLPSGKLYMSAYDYAKLSAADKEKVTPISTEDSTFARYPDDFYMYPAKLGMEGYQSACGYALAYVKLILEAQDDVAVELVCNDDIVKALATMQDA